MIKSFDLAKYEDVKQWSAKIAHSLSAKTMPADASQPWPDEWMVGGRRLQPVANARECHAIRGVYERGPRRSQACQATRPDNLTRTLTGNR
jgi:hypothetical protein